MSNKSHALFIAVFLSGIFSAGAGAMQDDANQSAVAPVAQTSSDTGDESVRLVDLSNRIDQLNEALNSGTVQISGLSFEMTEVEDSIEQGMVHFDDESGVLFENLPDTTFEVELLRHRSRYPERSVVLGGYLKVTGQHWSGDAMRTFNEAGEVTLTNGSSVSWLAALLDVYGAPNEWVSGFASFKASNSADNNDQLELGKGFVSIGNTDQYPLFALVGKTHLPFGVMGGGGPLSPSVTKSTFKSSTTPQLLVGFDDRTFNSNLAIFQNATSHRLTNFALSFFMTQKPLDALEYTLGLGYLSDARGTSSAFGKAFTTGGASRLYKDNRVGLYSLSSSIEYGPVEFNIEFVKSVSPVYVDTALEGLTTASQNLGRPESWYYSGRYKMLLLNKPTVFSLGYSAARHTEGVVQPVVSSVGSDLNSYYGLKDAWIAAVTRELGHNFYLALEYERAQSYFLETTRAVSLDLNYYF